MLKADAGDGEVAGQVAVAAAGRIRRVSLVPGDSSPPRPRRWSLAAADQVVIGPGSLYTSLLAAVAVTGVTEALAATTAQKVYVCNLRPQVPETEGYDVAAHVGALASTGWRWTWSWWTAAPPSSWARWTAPWWTGRWPGRTAWSTTLSDWRRPCRICWHEGSTGSLRKDEMTVRVGINGFGRIGRNFVRAQLAQGADLEVVAVNDITSPEMNAHLLRHDSTQGPLSESVEVEGQVLVVGGRRIQVLAERDPAVIPWGDLGVEVVVESTGRFTARADAAAHLKGGASRVIISAPAKDADATFVVGVNDGDFDPEAHVVISNASCTTNCFVPMVKVIDDAFAIAGGLMTTVHAYTNDQNLLDLPHQDLRRARAAAINIVPASTGAARATSLVLDSMKGRLDGCALRVPIPVGSITDFTAVVRGNPAAPEVNAAFAAAAAGPPLGDVLVYSADPLVSSDIVGSPASCIFDSELTMVQPLDDDRAMVKVQGWYDNEWGYSNRLVDLGIVGGGG